MSVQAVVTDINTQTLAYAPAVMAGVQAAELAYPAPGTGATKSAAVLGMIVASASAAGTVLSQSTNPTVASIGSLTALISAMAAIFFPKKTAVKVPGL